MRVLGIETSCDETGIAIYDTCCGLLVNQIYSQNKLHAQYGGVVPELAAREHSEKIIFLISLALKEANLNSYHIDGIAYTAGPGLSGALLIGATVAQSLAYAWKVPIIDVHHMEAHLLTPMLEEVKPMFPFVALLVSGGHTQLVLAQSLGKYKILGQSSDDAVGEVFDKIAVLLGLKYPGGADLSKMAKRGVSGCYKFPRPMIKKPGLDFSFSGLKTYVANTIMFSARDRQTRCNIARAFEEAIVETLVVKCRRALNETGLKCLVISGGVSANVMLRMNLADMIQQVFQGKLFAPRFELCTDNGAMIAYTGCIRLQLGLSLSNDLSIITRPRWSLESLFPINI